MVPSTTSNLLTETNLGQHNSRAMSTIASIRQEATQKFERSCFEYYHDLTDGVGSIENLPNLYRPTKPSDDSPMKRFFIMSTANESTLVIAEAEMRHAGIQYGSLLTIDVRCDAADAAAAITMAPLEVNPNLESDAELEELSKEIRKACRRAGALPKKGLAVARAPIMRQGTKTGNTEGGRQKS